MSYVLQVVRKTTRPNTIWFVNGYPDAMPILDAISALYHKNNVKKYESDGSSVPGQWTEKFTFLDQPSAEALKALLLSDPNYNIRLNYQNSVGITEVWSLTQV